MFRLGLLGFAPLLLTACLAPAPPHLCERGTLMVRADSEETAELVAGLVADIEPRVRHELEGSVEQPLEIWVQDDLRHYALPGAGSGAAGFLVPSEGRIHLSAACMTGPATAARIVLAHELVHALRDDVWARLDPPLEEGLADLIACRALPDSAAELQAELLLAASDGVDIWISFGDGSLPAVAQMTWTASESGFLEDLLAGGVVGPRDYGRAFLVLQRLDRLDRLRALRKACQRASTVNAVTLRDAAHLAGIDLGQAALAKVVRQRFDAPTLRAALANVAGPLARYLAGRLPPGAGDPEADFQSMGATFSVIGGRVRVWGDSVPGLLEAFVRARQGLAAARAGP